MKGLKKNTKTVNQVAGVRIGIRNKHLLNTNAERYLLSDLFRIFNHLSSFLTGE
jgi:hypothetical protein